VPGRLLNQFGDGEESQAYGDWRLCAVDDGRTEGFLETITFSLGAGRLAMRVNAESDSIELELITWSRADAHVLCVIGSAAFKLLFFFCFFISLNYDLGSRL
jgi:hypothetical protein